jgi:membrane protein DedA with SNARE-associated domain
VDLPQARIGQPEDTVAAERFNESFLSLVDVSPYVAILLLLTAGIWLIPFAEELALATAGYLYYAGEVQLAPILAVSGAGVFLGDFLAFGLGRRWSGTRLPHALDFLESRRWISLVGALLERYGMRALFWARFLPGVRLPAHILVGLQGMPVSAYTRVSLLSVIVYVPLMFGLAYSFGDEIEAALDSLQSLQEVAWGLFFVGVGLWWVIWLWLSRPSVVGPGRSVS